MTKQIGILHPGQMGISVAATMQNSGFEVVWTSSGRSQQSRDRAVEFQLTDVETVAKLCQTCGTIVSVCPPHAAEAVAQEVAEAGFQGLYIDANAIAPERAERINALLTAVGIDFVDGSIIGGPAWEPNRTWLYLSGPRADEATSYFAKGPLETAVLGEEIGKASAIKMCFAAYSKGTTALLCAILATAEELGVREDLQAQWSQNGSDFSKQAVNRATRVTAKAWRFAGEMEEISTTFAAAGLPGEFHAAANDVYSRLAPFKDAPDTPTLEEVLAALLKA